MRLANSWLLLAFPIVLASACGSGGGGESSVANPTATIMVTASEATPTPTGSPRAWTVGAAQGGADGESAIVRSEDGGRLWSSATIIDPTLRGIDFVDRTRGWAVGPGEILSTIDGGVSWISQAHNVAAPGPEILHDVAFGTAQRGVAVGAKSQPGSPSGAAQVLLTTDGGQEWLSAPITGTQPALSNSALRAVCLTRSGIGFAVGFGPSGNIALLSDDAGSSWRDITDRLPEPVFGAANPRDVACAEDRFLWAVGEQGVILHSSDAGMTWRDQSGNLPADLTPQLLTVAFGDAQNGWIAGSDFQGGALVLRTSDGGEHWREQSLPGAATGQLSGIAFADDMRGVAVGFQTVAGSGVAPVGFATSNAGSTWDVSLFTNEILMPMAVDIVP